jgi:hypothetical protein
VRPNRRDNLVESQLKFFNTVVLIEPAILPLLHLPEGTDVTIERDTDGRITIIDNDSGEPIVSDDID